MATKAELQAELLALRRQLAERSSQQQDVREEPHEDEEPPETPEPHTDWDREVSEIMSELEDFPHKQPLLFALGAFTVGFLIGRAR